MKSALVVKASLFRSQSKSLGTQVRLDYLPANTILLHLPARPVLAVEYLVGMVDIFPEFTRHIPLRIVRLGWWHRDKSSRQHFSGVLEDGLSPPFQFLVLGRWQASDEWAYANC